MHDWTINIDTAPAADLGGQEADEILLIALSDELNARSDVAGPAASMTGRSFGATFTVLGLQDVAAAVTYGCKAFTDAMQAAGGPALEIVSVTATADSELEQAA